MKDAAWRRNASGRCQATFDPEMSEWGNPIEQPSIIVQQCTEHTLGSETSQYQEEKKPIRISSVAASESEEAQTRDTRFWMLSKDGAQDLVHLGGCKAKISRTKVKGKKLQTVSIAEAAGKRRPRR